MDTDSMMELIHGMSMDHVGLWLTNGTEAGRCFHNYPAGSDCDL